MLKAPHLLRGRRSEKLAKKWLIRRGLKHLQSNFLCRHGELDLIMLDHECLVIVEVRFRASHSWGDGLASITPAKQHKLARATEEFLRQRRAYRHMPLRFDVVAMTSRGGKYEFDWRPAAFCMDED